MNTFLLRHRRALRVKSGEWRVESGEWAVSRHFAFCISFFRLPPSAFRPRRSALRPPPSAFTLVELLVTITIIGLLAAMVLGALHAARQTAREYATKATIAKLNNIIMQRYESYMTRRVPIQIPAGAPPPVAARMRLDAIRDLMRMEMPDARSDIIDASSNDAAPITFSYTYAVMGATVTSTVTVPEPALHMLYYAARNRPTANFDSAQCLYLIVSLGSPEAMEQFHQSEIGERDGHPVFIDAWGTPICWLRWAPGYSNWNGVTPPTGVTPGGSEVQSGKSDSDSDPFDPRKVDNDTTLTHPRGFKLIPFICSAGPDRHFGLVGLPIRPSPARTPIDDPYADLTCGGSDGGNTHYDNITNHYIEQR